MWLLIILIVIIILGILEQMNIEKYLNKNSTYIISPIDGFQMYTNPYTGNNFLMCSSTTHISDELRTKFPYKHKPRKLVVTQIAKPVYKMLTGLTEISKITPLTDFCGLAEPIIKTAIRPNLNEHYYTIYTKDKIHTLMFENKICLFNV